MLLKLLLKKQFLQRLKKDTMIANPMTLIEKLEGYGQKFNNWWDTRLYGALGENEGKFGESPEHYRTLIQRLDKATVNIIVVGSEYENLCGYNRNVPGQEVWDYVQSHYDKKLFPKSHEGKKLEDQDFAVQVRQKNGKKFIRLKGMILLDSSRTFYLRQEYVVTIKET